MLSCPSLGILRYVYLAHLKKPSCSPSKTLSSLSAIRRGIRKSTKDIPSAASPRSEGGTEWPPRGTQSGASTLLSRDKNHRGIRDSKLEVRTPYSAKARDLSKSAGWRLQKLPYTTPASEFLYGTSSVLAALEAGRRKCYKLYISTQLGDSQDRSSLYKSLRRLAASRGAEIFDAKERYERALDHASQGRPHNGLILEASALPKWPVTALLQARSRQPTFTVSLGPQSQEEKLISGNDPKIKKASSERRYPFVVMLDGILDPGNLGAILRSAFFLGADAVVLSSHNAELGPVAGKASAGAAETLPLLTVHSTGAFVEASRTNGWSVYAAVAPPDASSLSSTSRQPHVFSSKLSEPLENGPCLLMLGSEGDGLRRDLVRKASYLLSIGGERSGQGGVDSLNVSVAAALLCEAFLRKPTQSMQNPAPGAEEIGENTKSQKDLF